MYSLLDSMVTVDEEHSAVTIIYKNNHAALILESVRPDDSDSREIRFAHFLPKEIKRGENKLENIANFLDDFKSEAREGRVELKIISASTAKEIRQILGVTHQTTTYQINDQSKMRELIKNINGEARDGWIVSKFQLRGASVNDGRAHNCRSWVRAKLALVDCHISVNFVDKVTSDTLASDDYSSSKAKCIIL